ncbi:MAG: LysR family transcriptional regulator [Gammaproteobacteria bacterium]|nr:LysR family transcriptional regulator [Gammaproteobacteria bacterium]
MKSAEFPNLPPMASLVVFEAAARQVSFRKAGDELCISASAVAHQIKQLEQSLGVALFIRHSRGVSLSLEGQEYLSQIQPLLVQLQHHSRRLGDLSRRPLRIVTLHAIAQLWLQPQLSRYQAAHQDHDIEITASSQLLSLPQDADLAIGYFEAAPPSERWIRLWDEYVLPVCSPNYGVSEGQAVLYHDIHWAKDWSRWSQANKAQSLEFAHHRRASLYVLVLQSALDGLGAMVARQSLVAGQLQRGELVAYPGANAAQWVPGGAYYLCRSQGSYANPFAEQFCQWLLSAVQGTAGV